MGLLRAAHTHTHSVYHDRLLQQVAARRRASAALQIPLPRPRGGGKRTKEERTTDTFRRARSRLQAILARLLSPCWQPMGAGCMRSPRAARCSCPSTAQRVAECSGVYRFRGSALPLVKLKAITKGEKVHPLPAHRTEGGRAEGRVRGQESENAVLFSRKSFWRDTCRSLGECWTVTSQYTSLWKTAIQTIEGKHGARRALHSGFPCS